MENFRLRIFRTVAHHLNFRIAAEELLLTQPAVSQQIKALESELSAPLFDRSGGRVTLTAAGHALLPYATQLQALSEQAVQAVAAISGATAGQLSIGASQTIGQYLLPRLAAAFLKDHPRVELAIQGGNTQQVVEMLRARHLHLALIEGPALGNDIQLKSFLADTMVCVVPAAHEWAGITIAASDLRSTTILMREHGSGSRRIVEGALRDAGLGPRELNLGLTFDSTEGLLTAVEAGLGITFVSRWAVRNQLALGTLALVTVQGLALERMFSLATVTGPELTGVAGSFYNFVLERAPLLSEHRGSANNRAPAKTGTAAPHPRSAR